MTTDAAQSRDDSRLLDLRDARRDAITAGTVFPSFDDLQQGLPFLADDFTADLRAYISTLLLDKKMPGDLRSALELALANPTADTLRAAADATDHSGSEECRRLDLYACWLGDPVGRDRMIRRGFEDLDKSLTTAGFALALACGLAQYAPLRFGAKPKLDRDSVNRVVDRGLEHMERAGELAARLTAAMAKADANAVDPVDPLEEIYALVEEDRAEIVVEDGIPEALTGAPVAPVLPTLIVVPALDPKGGTSNTRDIRKSWAGITGEGLPLVQAGDIAGAANRLTARWPHARDIIHTLLGDLALGGSIRFRPTLIVGRPGSGKTALLRAIAIEVGLPVEAYNLGGMADASLMGTSSQWSTARESTALQLIKRSKTANPAIIWDEIEKVGDSKNNGSALDALLPMFEQHQAKAMRDLCLEVEVDLSMVSHLATANTTADMPAPLRDRMRILRMPDPNWSHLGVLVGQIVDDIARERGIDPRWYARLAEDEVDLVRNAWPGGSLRRLRRTVEVILDGRDSWMGRA